MIDVNLHSAKRAVAGAGQLSYVEVVEYLDVHWSVATGAQTMERMRQLDMALGSPSKKLATIAVAGTNGKSLTVHFACKLFKVEGLKAGALIAPHVMTYNERIVCQGESIPNKSFAELGSKVIEAAREAGLNCHSDELLTMMALEYFVQQGVDVAVLEAGLAGKWHPVNICDSKVLTITRVTEHVSIMDQHALDAVITSYMQLARPESWVVSGDQSKAHLQIMQNEAKRIGAHWAMPIRKLACMPYPFEQLHGRCAALAERMCQLFVEKFLNRGATVVESILSRQKGQRGRPTIEAKKLAELNPKRTTEHFWKEVCNELPGRFELLDKEKPSVLLDNASNFDAFKNLVLGIRLLHYQKSLKGLAIIFAASKDTLHSEEFLKLVRYFFKKISGQIFICPVEQPLFGAHEAQSWDVDAVTNDFKTLKMKARPCATFAEAFDLAKKSVDERNGLVVITGSQSIIHAYWQTKGIKKLA